MVLPGIFGAHCLLAANVTSSGGLTGSVVDDSGRPVAGARVLISYTPSIKPPVAPLFSRAALSDETMQSQYFSIAL
jgi:hypothetical protein